MPHLTLINLVSAPLGLDLGGAFLCAPGARLGLRRKRARIRARRPTKGTNMGRVLYPACGRLSGLSFGASHACFPKAVAFGFFRSIAIFAARSAWRVGPDEPLHLL